MADNTWTQTAGMTSDTGTDNLQTYSEQALASKNSAADSAATATTKADTATTKASEASTSETNAATSASTATTKASEASTSATNAATSASTATTKASEASTSATNAATSASTATTKASEASTSATNAATSASTSTTKASEASTSASGASTSASTATTKASEASTSATNAATSASTATTKASEASTSETNAATSASTATTKASEASTSATNAATSASTATTKASEASTSAANAASSATNAATSETNAATAETNAQTAETNAETAETNAATSASTATTKASEASTSETNAATSASTATTKASEASTSATNAATSASTATTKASEASTSATNAATSASTATTKASEASTSATNAATSASTATTKASEASTSATNAASSASTATTKASEASTSATNAASSASASASSATAAQTAETNAETAETNAGVSASTATTKASEASTSASAAATSASTATASKDAALAALDSFDDRYLGQKSADVTVDNDGDALVAGALYFNTTTDAMMVYEGSSWVAAYASLSGALIAASNLSDLANASAARTNLGLAIGTNVQAYSAVLAATTASYTTARNAKLSGIETSATADQTAAEIRTAVEAATDSNVFTDADHSKLNAIETSATADQTAAEIRTAVEAATDSNVFTDADHSKLNAIETSATADQTAAQLLTAIKTVDGAGSGLDADLLDGNHASAFLQSYTEADTLATVTGRGATTTSTVVINSNNTALQGLSVGEAFTNYDGWHGQINLHGTGHARYTIKTSNVRMGMYAHDSWHNISGSTQNGHLGTYTNHGVGFVVNATLKMALNTSGNLGINVSAPTEKLDVGGNIKVSGTVDGRDVAADGTKLDTIATSANNYSFPYTVSTSAGNSTVVQRDASGHIFGNWINATGTFATSANSSGMGRFTGTNGADAWGRSYTAAAARTLLNVADGANNYSLPAAPSVTHLNVADKINHTGDTDTYFQFHGANLARMFLAGAEVQEWGSGYTSFNDNVQIRIGTGSDFRIQFNGADTVFRNYAHANGDVYFQGEGSDGANENALALDFSGTASYVRLFQNDAEKLRTTSGGAAAMGLFIGGLTTNPHNAGALEVGAANNEKIVLSGSADPFIRFQEGTTDKAYMQWNSSDGFLQFRNQESGGFRFRGAATTTAVQLLLEASDGDIYGSVYADHSNNIGFLDDDNHWMYRATTDSHHEWRINNGVEMSLTTSTLDMKGNTITEVEDIGLRDSLYHDGDTDTYMQFHASDQWRVVTGGAERLEVNNSQITSTEPIHAPSFHGDGSSLTGVGGSTTAGAIGTYCWARNTGSATTASTGTGSSFNFGTTYAGTGLFPAGFSGEAAGNFGNAYFYNYTSGVAVGSNSNSALSGTWRCMGQTSISSPYYDEVPVTLFVRIS